MAEQLHEDCGIKYGSLYICYLVDDCKRITSKHFTVHIPSIMNGNVDTGGKIAVDKKKCLNDNKVINENVETIGSIIASNGTQYNARIDGWSPEFKIQKTTGTSVVLGAGEITGIAGGTKVAGEHPHTHDLLTSQSESQMTASTIEFVNGVETVITEIDLMDINKKYIYKGHKMTGYFPIGGAMTDFVINHIYDVTCFFDETEPSSSDVNVPNNAHNSK